MADGGDAGSDSWENWWGGWVQAAKEKSNSALEFVKKDLAEFTCTVQKEAEKAVERTKESLSKENTEQTSNMVKSGITSFLDNISRALVIPPDDDYVPVKISADGTALYNRGIARLHAIQLDASTYMEPPRGTPEQFSMWLDSFDMEEHKGQISELLVTKVEVRSLYTRLVPSDVSHAEFWQRYFYKVHQLDCDEARKQALMKRAEKTSGDTLGWEDDWSGGEEDDGNQSDWEKMPRPKGSDASKKCPPLGPSVPNDPSISQPDLVSVSHSAASIEKPSQQSAQPQSPVESSVPSSGSQVCDQGESSAIPEDRNSSLEEGLSQQEEEARNQAKLWSLHIPSDIASASHEDQDEESYPEQVVVIEPTDTQARVDLSCAAAAAGFEVSEDNAGTVSAAGGACGALDTITLSNTLPYTPCSDIPAASSISTQKDCQSESTHLSSDRNEDATSTQDVEVEVNAARAQAAKDVPEAAKELNICDQPGGNDVNPSILEVDNSTGIAVSEKGDMVVVGDRISPSTESNDSKDILDEDWEKDFDIEVTEEDLKAAEDIAIKLGENLDAEDDDWENWE